MVASVRPVVVRAGALETLPETVRAVAPDHRIAIITDENVGPLHGQRVASLLSLDPSSVLQVPAGERHKTRATWQWLTDAMLERRLARDTVVVALGGGVVGDLAGFVAATYMRGVPVVQIPTTLLAMVDASIGGKTGVDTPAGKNLVGAFHPAAAVIIDPLLLETLEPAHLRAGFAEIVKHGVVADAAYFERACAFAERWPLASVVRQGLHELTDLIARSVEIKTDIVARDERESGVRKVLNFGHTIGHAIESATNFETLHGEAVAIGQVMEARLAERIGVARAGTARVIERVCRAAGLPTSLPDVSPEALIGFTRSDKKARAGHAEYALPAKIGEMAGADRGWTVRVDDTAVLQALTP